MQQYTASNGLIRLKSVPAFSLQIPSGETVDSVQHFAYVLDCISMLFQRYVPQIGSTELTIINQPAAQTPVCYRPFRIILLTTAPSLWSQIAFQYAHELCHYSIPSDVDQNLRWLEESICEVASLYFLRQIGYYWLEIKENLTTSDGVPYAISFLKYANDRLEGVTPFDLRDASEIRELELDCYNRARNNYVASRLLPIFARHPAIWAAVPLLCRVHKTSLVQTLDEWILVSPQAARPGLQEIRNLF